MEHLEQQPSSSGHEAEPTLFTVHKCEAGDSGFMQLQRAVMKAYGDPMDWVEKGEAARFSAWVSEKLVDQNLCTIELQEAISEFCGHQNSESRQLH